MEIDYNIVGKPPIVDVSSYIQHFNSIDGE